MNIQRVLIGGLPRRPIVHAEVRNVEATHRTGVTNTPRSELALANQDPELFIESELQRRSIRECPSLVPGSWLTLSLRGLDRSRRGDSYWLERWCIGTERTGRKKGTVVLPWWGERGKTTLGAPQPEPSFVLGSGHSDALGLALGGWLGELMPTVLRPTRCRVIEIFRLIEGALAGSRS